MATVIDKLRGDHDFVLVDAPPVLSVADPTGLAVHVDGVLLTVRYGSTRKEDLRQAAATLEQVGANLLGVVLTIVPPKARLTPVHGYGVTYAEGSGKHAGR
jgi:receptor protein-tyrosine kinase